MIVRMIRWGACTLSLGVDGGWMTSGHHLTIQVRPLLDVIWENCHHHLVTCESSRGNPHPWTAGSTLR